MDLPYSKHNLQLSLYEQQQQHQQQSTGSKKKESSHQSHSHQHSGSDSFFNRVFGHHSSSESSRGSLASKNRLFN